MIPSIEACWDWLYRREELNVPFDFFVCEDANERARQLISPLENYFLDSKAYSYCFYNAYSHYFIVTDYRVKYEEVWKTRKLGDLDRLPLAQLTNATVMMPPGVETNLTELTESKTSIPMTNLTKSKTSIPMTNLTNATVTAPKPETELTESKTSIPMTNLTESKTSSPMTELTESQVWVINKLYIKYNIASAGAIYNSVSDGSSSTSVQMFESLNRGDFLMQDLLRTPYGTFVYQTLEQMRVTAVLL